MTRSIFPLSGLPQSQLVGSFFHYSLYLLRVEAVSNTSQESIISSAFSRMCLLADVQTVSTPLKLLCLDTVPILNLSWDKGNLSQVTQL